MNVFEEEAVRATLYRDQWDARIAFRADQLRRFSGQLDAFAELWGAFRPIFDKTNYISLTPIGKEGSSDTPGNEGSYLTPYDFDDNGSISSSSVRLPSTIHASEQNDKPHGA